MDDDFSFSLMNAQRLTMSTQTTTTKVSFTDLETGDEVTLLPELIHEVRAAEYEGESCVMVAATIGVGEGEPSDATFLTKSLSFTNYHLDS